MTHCAYRVVLANSHEHPLLPYPASSHLGNVIHEGIELIVKGKINSIAEFDRAWCTLVAKEEQKLKTMGFGFLVPLHENVSGYTIKKIQVRSLLEGRTNKRNTGPHKNKGQSILTEKWLEAKDSLIGGYADIIIDYNGHIKLSDYKSGKILQEEGDIKEEYENQLKLYAYLYNEVYGTFPHELSIIDLDRKEYPVIFTTQECNELATRSKNKLAETNRFIVSGKIRSLAKPDPDYCKSCLYRPACSFYWELPPDATDAPFQDVRGTIKETKQFHNGNLNVTVTNDGRELVVSKLDGNHLGYLSKSTGKEMVFYNVRQCGSPEIFQAIKSTKFYEI